MFHVLRKTKYLYFLSYSVISRHKRLHEAGIGAACEITHSIKIYGTNMTLSVYLKCNICENRSKDTSCILLVLNVREALINLIHYYTRKFVNGGRHERVDMFGEMKTALNASEIKVHS